MATTPFLSKDGLSHLWDGLKTQLGKKSDVGHTHSAATTSAAGFLSAADKAKLTNLTKVYSATIE